MGIRKLYMDNWKPIACMEGFFSAVRDGILRLQKDLRL